MSVMYLHECTACLQSGIPILDPRLEAYQCILYKMYRECIERSIPIECDAFLHECMLVPLGLTPMWVWCQI